MNMTEIDLDEVTRQLAKASVGQSGVSFEGKGLKLNTEDDAKEVVEAIQNCRSLDYLNLEGNTLGVDASKAVGKALEAHGELKRALWKDLFTGRKKCEIPKALQFLGAGLVLAKAQLVELDLSDNALGSIGVDGVAALLQSEACYTLQVLKLNNNGLGVTGGKVLSKALLNCYNNSTLAGKPLALRVVIVGRNRLENEGAKALAKVFGTVGTLEQVELPQNGIYHQGISALCDAFSQNTNLRVLNLEDNTITPKGAVTLAQVLPSLQNLHNLNLGDCLLRTKGALILAEALISGHLELTDVQLSSNEIGAKGGVALAKAMQNKTKLKQLNLNENQFGEPGRLSLTTELTNNGRLDALGSLSGDEDEDEEEEEDHNDDDEEEEEGDENLEEEDQEETTEEVKPEVPQQEHLQTRVGSQTFLPIVQDAINTRVSVSDFLQNPTPELFIELGNNRCELILEEVKGYSRDTFTDKALPVLMKVSALSGSSVETTRRAALTCTEMLYRELFRWAEAENGFSVVTNALLVHLGLIKSEDKKMKLPWNLEGCLIALDVVAQRDFFPSSTRSSLELFLGRQVLDVETNATVPASPRVSSLIREIRL